jgi:hypothetical protein
MTGKVINGLHIRQGALLLEPRELYDSAIVATTQTGSAVYCVDRILELLTTGEEAMEEQAAIDHFNYKILGGSFAEAEDIRPFFRDPIDGEIF